HNMTASNLRRGDHKSFMIGLMLEDVSNPYSSSIYRAVENVARERGVGLLAADSVMADNRAGPIAAVRHLIGHGHRRIAFLGDLISIATCQDRYSGYQEALREAGLTEDLRIIRRDLHTAAAAEAPVAELLAGPEPPSALFSAQNLITLGTVRALRAGGAQHRMAMVGFDDVPLADMLDPPVTVVAQDMAAIGTLAAQILFRRIDGDVS